MMEPVHPFEKSLADSWPLQRRREMGIVVAISGGADSVALLRAMHVLHGETGNRLAVAHFNHGLRGGESDADQRFVEQLCQQLALECRVGQPAGPLSDLRPDGLEAAARQARYEFLRHTAEQLGARYVATAHTANDQAETILHHVLRGTGLAGAAGMPRVRSLGPAVTLMRPLLEISRQDVLGYLADIGQPFCEDASNRDIEFTRNRIRRDLLPRLEQDYGPGVADALRRLGTIAGDAQRLIESLAMQLLERCTLRSDANSLALDCRQVAGQDRHLVRELFVAAWRQHGWPQGNMGFAQWNLLADMALDPCQKHPQHVLPGAITIRRHDDQLLLQADTPN